MERWLAFGELYRSGINNASTKLGKVGVYMNPTIVVVSQSWNHIVHDLRLVYFPRLLRVTFILVSFVLQ